MFSLFFLLDQKEAKNQWLLNKFSAFYDALFFCAKQAIRRL
jgi:hypothetical protein